MLSSIRVQQFRSYDDASFEFEPGVNIVVGPNASGKTNLLEAILVLAQGRSFRAKDRELIKHDKEWARIDGLWDAHPRSVKLQPSSSSSRIIKSFDINDVSKKRLQLADTLPIVLFEPTDLQLLSGSPERRRNFLDTMLARTVPRYQQMLRSYERVLAQRNALLKQGSPPTKDELFVWNIRLSELGGYIAEQRIDLVKTLNKQITEHYQAVAGGKQKITVAYSSRIEPGHYSTALLQHLEKHLDKDVQRGFTGVGPHRDDIAVKFDDVPVSEVASRGEIRTLVLGFKMLELSLVEKARNQKPILLLDDVFSELDGARRKALTDFLKDHQTFITTTDADVVVEHFLEKAHVIAL